MTSSARSCRRKIRSTTPKSFARVAAYRRSKAASSPFATAAISQTSSAGVSIQRPPKPRFLQRFAPAAIRDVSSITRQTTVHQMAGFTDVIKRKTRALRSGSDAGAMLGKTMSGDGAEPGAHQADRVHVGLLAGVLFGALAGLVALVEQL